MTVTYTVGDTREVIATIPDGSVDLVATSPPFYQLRSYVPTEHDNKHQEIGSESDPATFLDTLLELTAEWGRVLAPHGSIAIELGDTYSGSGGPGGDYNEGGLREGQGKADGSARAQRNTSSIKANPKSLACIPDLYTIALAYGIHPLTGKESPAGKWLVRNKVVWHRPNPAVGALGDKVRPSTSYIVVATRSAKRWFDLTAVRTPYTELTLKPHGPEAEARRGRGSLNGTKSPMARGMENGALTHAGAPPLDAWFDQYDGTHDTWTLTTQPSRLAHYAMWPAKLAERLILSMCPREVCRACGEPRRRMETATRTTDDHYGDWQLTRIGGTRLAHHGSTTNETLGWTDCGHGEWGPSYHGPNDRWESSYRPGLVLDPFAGSGTTLAVADLHGCDAIGIDFNSENKLIYPARYDEVKKALYGTPAPMPGQGDLFAEVAG